MLAGQITKLAAAVGAKIKELEGKISQGGRKCEYINVSKEMWISNGYPYTENINFILFSAKIAPQARSFSRSIAFSDDFSPNCVILIPRIAQMYITF
jgi:hypothetical protein